MTADYELTQVCWLMSGEAVEILVIEGEWVRKAEGTVCVTDHYGGVAEGFNKEVLAHPGGAYLAREVKLQESKRWQRLRNYLKILTHKCIEWFLGRHVWFHQQHGRNRMTGQETLGTIWKVPDELWEIIEPIILEEDLPKTRGRKRACPRQMLNGIILRLRSGCQWNRLPKELGDDSTIHRTFQRWVELGVLQRMWGVLVEGCEELGDVDWEWQSADAAMGKVRFGGT